MRRGFWIFATAILTLALLAWFARKPPRPLTQPEDVAAVSPSNAATKAAVDASKRPGFESSPSPLAPTILEYRHGKIDQDEARRKILSKFNDVPIVFCGRLEDQFGKPVGGAQITGTTTIINGTTTGAKRVVTMSDNKGFFRLDAGKGQSIGIMPKKEGYTLATTSTEFNYSLLSEDHFTSDPSNPVIIRMWKLQGAQKLISFDIKEYVPCDGTPTIFDLQTAQRVHSGGDILVAIESTNAPSVKEGYNWKAHLETAGGGMIQVSEMRPEQMLGAPESGYAPMFDLTRDYDAQPWNARFRGAFYFTSRGGRFYGRFSVDILSDVVKDGRVYLRLSGVLNPVGSRDLEVDPSLVTQAHP